MEFKPKEVTALCIFGSIAALTLYAIYVNYVSPPPTNENSNNDGPAADQNQNQDQVALNPQRYQKFVLDKKTNVSHNTRLFRFRLQTQTTVLGLPCGNHMSLRFFDAKNSSNEDGSPEEVRRPYTPVTSDDNVGYFELIVKIYERGRMTQYLDSLAIGKSVEVRGPLGRVNYAGNGKFRLKRRSSFEDLQVKQIGMIAGGTGITPMMQVIRQICKDPTDQTQVSLIFGNVSMDDILLFDELKAVREKHDNIHIFFTIDKGPTDGREWEEGIGYVTLDMLREKIFPAGNDTIVLNCGPPIMMKICEKNLFSLGHTKERVAKF